MDTSVQKIKKSFFKKRAGQTAVEYLLVTVCLTVVFATMYKALQYSLTQQFQWGGKIIVRTYEVDNSYYK